MTTINYAEVKSLVFAPKYRNDTTVVGITINSLYKETNKAVCFLVGRSDMKLWFPKAALFNKDSAKRLHVKHWFKFEEGSYAANVFEKIVEVYI